MTALPQHMQARELANATRIASSEYKNHIRNLPPGAAVDRVVQALTEGDEQAGPIRVRALLMAITLMGDQKATRVLLRAGVANVDRKVRDLTPRQREAIAAELEEVTARWSR